jgi:hypothetical protein
MEPLSSLRVKLDLLSQRERAVLDLVFIALGVGVFVAFAGYAALLRRA